MPAPRKNSVLLNGTYHHAGFRAADGRLGVPGIEGIVDRGVPPLEVVAAPAERGAKPVRPVDRVLAVDADAAFADFVCADVGVECALGGVGEPKADRVVAGLDAERGLGRQAGIDVFIGARGAAARIDAVIALMELVAEDRRASGLPADVGRDRVAAGNLRDVVLAVRGEPFKIVVEVERVTDHIGVGLPRSGLVRLRDTGGQRQAAGVAAVGRIEFAIERNDARGDRPQRHLVGGVPFVGIGHGGDGEAVGGGALAVAHHAAELAHVVGIDPWPVVGDRLGGDEEVAVQRPGSSRSRIAARIRSCPSTVPPCAVRYPSG